MNKDPYTDADYAALYDLSASDAVDDIPLYQQFARRCQSPILELGVGTGRVAIPLAREGFEVWGVDSSEAMLARCRKKVRGAIARRLRLVLADMRAFALGQLFDLIFAAHGTFQTLLSSEDQRACLRCVHRHLTTSGVFVAELRSLTEVDWSEEEAALRLQWVRADPESGEMVMRFDAVQPRPGEQIRLRTLIYDRIGADGIVRRRVVESPLRLVGRYEMELLLGEAGLELVNVYGDYDLLPYDGSGPTMIVVARRKG